MEKHTPRPLTQGADQDDQDENSHSPSERPKDGRKSSCPFHRPSWIQARQDGCERLEAVDKDAGPVGERESGLSHEEVLGLALERARAVVPYVARAMRDDLALRALVGDVRMKLAGDLQNGTFRFAGAELLDHWLASCAKRLIREEHKRSAAYERSVLRPWRERHAAETRDRVRYELEAASPEFLVAGGEAELARRIQAKLKRALAEVDPRDKCTIRDAAKRTRPATAVERVRLHRARVRAREVLLRHGIRSARRVVTDDDASEEER